jgi:hypothetical protein
MELPPVTPDDSGAFSLLFDDKYEVAFSPDDGDGTVVFHADLDDAVALMAPPVASKLNFRYPVNPPFPKPANAAALQKECENRPAARGR